MLAVQRLRNLSNVRASRAFSTGVEVTKLPNGFTVATQKTHDLHNTVGLYADVGSRDEKITGESRLLERMIYRGTKSRPMEKLQNDIDSIGGILDVNVGKEQSRFSLTSMGGDVKGSIDLVKDVVFNSGFDAADFEQVKMDTESAVDTANISTQDLIMDRTFMNCFRDCGLGNTFFPEDTSEMTHSSLKSYVSDNFTGNKLVLSAVGGNVDHSAVVKEAQAAFGGLSATAKGKGIVDYKPYFLGAIMNYRNDEMGPLVYMTISWQTVSWRSPDALTFLLIAQILGEYHKHDPQKILPGVLSGNRLINNCANRGDGFGCIDYHKATQTFFRDTGVLSVYSVCDEIALQDARSEIQFIINMLAGAVMDEEVEKAKRELKLKLFQEQYQGNTINKANTIGQHILSYGRFVDIHEICHRIDDLSAADVKRAAYEHMHDSELSVVALGPTHGMMQYEQIRADNCARRF